LLLVFPSTALAGTLPFHDESALGVPPVRKFGIYPPDADGDDDALGLNEGLSLGEGDSLGLALGLALGDGETEGDKEGLGLIDGLTLGLSDATGSCRFAVGDPSKSPS
jgi:hypothetical protein